jgi:hypothetical protein
MNNICKYCLSTTTCCDDIETENCSNYIEFQKEPKQEKERGLIIKKSDGSIIKQETIEEAAEKYKYNPKGDFCFTKGAKWQAERMYSEEDMKLAFEAGILFSKESVSTCEEAINTEYELFIQNIKNQTK